MENPIKMDFLGVPLFSETPIYLCNLKFQIPRFVLLDFGVVDDSLTSGPLKLEHWSKAIKALPTTSTRNKG